MGSGEAVLLAPFITMPGAPSSFLLLVVRPGAPSSVRPGAPSSVLAPIARPGAPSSVLAPSSTARSP